MAYEVIFEGQGLLFVFTDQSDSLEMQKANAEGWENQNFYKTCYQIWDFSQTEQLHMDVEDSMVNAKSDNAAFSNFKEMKIAFVATTPQVRALCQSYMDHVDSTLVPTFLCDTIDEARKWIGDAAK